ncbi:DUF6328 family protein [Streptomyces megasporus]|uniref:DUF6328 family protein n=1 Tax=Streptomyces megasporus TaxID=44060 RepID=UPI000A9F27A0|nr:DUF6328 family protein [Streptomyces megasporus]
MRAEPDSPDSTAGGITGERPSATHHETAHHETAYHETEKERADRRWTELLQEVRVAQMGIQILLGFLLSVAFTERFEDLGSTDRTIYVVTVVLGSAATGTLIAPVALHRFVTGHRMKPQTVEWASRLTISGLVLLLCTVTCALLLILRVVLHNATAWWIVGGLFLWFVAVWFLLPAWARATKGAAAHR